MFLFVFLPNYAARQRLTQILKMWLSWHRYWFVLGIFKYHDNPTLPKHIARWQIRSLPQAMIPHIVEVMAELLGKNITNV